MTKSPRSTAADDCAIGNRIRSHRKAKKISQEVLGEALGVSFQQVQKYEGGANRVGAARLKVIAKFLDVSINDLLGGDAGETSGDATELLAFMAQPQGIRLARVFARLTPLQGGALAEFVERLLEPAPPAD